MAVELKEVFIFNETYPLPKEAYAIYKKKVTDCSENPMCLNNVKADVEGYIAKWGKSSGKKLEEGDESGFTILKDDQDFFSEAKTDSGKPKIDYIKLTGILGIIIMGALAIQKKSVWAGIATLLLVALIFIPTEKFKTLFSSASAVVKKDE